jgi:hypothetical protein
VKHLRKKSPQPLPAIQFDTIGVCIIDLNAHKELSLQQLNFFSTIAMSCKNIETSYTKSTKHKKLSHIKCMYSFGDERTLLRYFSRSVGDLTCDWKKHGKIYLSPVWNYITFKPCQSIAEKVKLRTRSFALRWTLIRQELVEKSLKSVVAFLHEALHHDNHDPYDTELFSQTLKIFKQLFSIEIIHQKVHVSDFLREKKFVYIMDEGVFREE